MDVTNNLDGTVSVLAGGEVPLVLGTQAYALSGKSAGFRRLAGHVVRRRQLSVFILRPTGCAPEHAELGD